MHYSGGFMVNLLKLNEVLQMLTYMKQFQMASKGNKTNLLLQYLPYSLVFEFQMATNAPKSANGKKKGISSR